jgi:FlaA1/EpsC-like NDP-sugar epimerase
MIALFERLRQQRAAFVGAFDVAAWVLGYFVTGSVLYLLGSHHRSFLIGSVIAGAALGLVFLLFGRIGRLQQGRARLGSFEDAALAAATAIATIFVGVLINLARVVPAQVFALGIWPSLVFLLGWRGLYRLLVEQAVVPLADGARRVVIAGAGNAGSQLVNAMLSESKGNWRPVAFVDDDPLKRHRRIRGVPVLGRLDDLVEVALNADAETVIVAIPSASADTIRSISGAGSDAGLEVKVLPSTDDLLAPGRVGIADIRDIEVTDLLGRHQIETDVASIAGYLAGKRVLVTGAGGSIGAELCRQIAKFGPSELIMLDRDESALHATQLSIYGKAMLDDDSTVLADIREPRAIHDLFEVRQPQVVFHAAALKHLPMLEKAPGEAIKTNVWGTLTVLEAAAKVGVEKFVNISTDKAANPINVLGYSKRVAEGLTATVAEGAQGTFLSVRFGNVLGSRGSVLTAFAAQIASGGPLTVTDPGVTRYFMTIKEAVQLVIQAAAIGSDGEALVLDMGAPVSINTVAHQLIEMSGKRVEVVYSGLRDGEKMHEELFGHGELDVRNAHPLISHTRVPGTDLGLVRSLDPWGTRSAAIESLSALCSSMSQKVLEGSHA